MQTILSRISADISSKWSNITNNPLKKAGLNWFKKRHLKYSLPGKVKTHYLRGKKIYFRNGLELLHSLKEIFIQEVYKMKFDSEQPYVIDCGANIGLSVLYMKQQFPKSQILAFEPDESNFHLLQKNTENLENVTVVQKAVWKENTIINFAAAGTLSSQIVFDMPDMNKNTIKIEAVRLRDYLDKPVDLLKLDIEGAEYEVLKDCANNLDMVANMFVEYHGNFNQQSELTEIFNLLDKKKFCYYIKEASEVYPTPFYREKATAAHDTQLNIFCFKKI